jgi:iron complex transport system ATP-binding protein
MRHPNPAERTGSSPDRGSPTPSAWTTRALTLRYPGADRPALDGVTLDLPAGRCTAVLGPNGAGKSTLLQLLLGTLAPTSGEACFEGRAAARWARRDFARAVGVVPQLEEAAFPLTVRELVAMGRYPHLGPWRREGPDDRRAIDEAMHICDVATLADRPLRTLSGGERQRARVARALAQEPRALVLDEPTASLDIRHEMAIFELLPTLCARGATVLVITHHLNLAARYAHRLVLLHRGRVVADGPPAAVLTRTIVEQVYGWPVAIAQHPGPGPDTGVPQVIPLAGAACASMMPQPAAPAIPDS